ncbi:MAG: hypothetical protein JO132_02360 [Streptosporangiaceae bacterium]|nr:hypothetical protein [Streptosporangiaceae bacterium]
MHALVDDDRGRLTLRPLRPWHQMLARCRAARLDRELADGARPEVSALLAARALQLTSGGYRRALAANLNRLAPGSAALAGSLAGSDPVPARAVAMVAALLADGAGPLYRDARRDDLPAMIERARAALGG